MNSLKKKRKQLRKQYEELLEYFSEDEIVQHLEDVEHVYLNSFEADNNEERQKKVMILKEIKRKFLPNE